MPRTRLAFAAVPILVLWAAVACGPRSRGGGGGGGAMPAAVSAYAGLRWVPADATYAVASRKTSDVVAVWAEMIDAAGLLAGWSLDEARADATRELGVDVFTDEALAEVGVDVGRGAAIWSRGLGPTLALPLADPQRFAAKLDELRGSAVVQVGRAHDADVYTLLVQGDAALHWTIAGDWFLLHLESRGEREADGAWLESAWTARGGLAGHADFTAAVDEASRRLGADPPVVGLVRMKAVMALPLIAELGVFAPRCVPFLAAVDRVFVSAVAHEGDARGAVVVELGAAADELRRHVLPAPAGWEAARAKAPLQADVGYDLHALSAALEPCIREDLVAQHDLQDVRGLRFFLHALDVDDMEGRGAALVEVKDPAFLKRTIAEARDEIPGISLMSRTRTVGALTVTEVNVPSFPGISYATSGTTGLVTVDMPFGDVLGAGLVAGGGELFHLAVRPKAWPEETWHDVLREFIGRDDARALLIKRLRQWTLGEVTVSLEGRALVLTGHGAR